MILAAGYGTRMLPATKSQPKEMLPVVDKPVIHYAVEELVSSGIEHITIVTAINKRSVEDYFDRSRDVEEQLAKRNDTQRLEELLAISTMAKFTYVRQAEARGLADAVNTARHLVEDEPFVLVLPDDIIVGDPPASKQLIDCYNEYGGGVVAVEEVPEAEVSSYGIVAGQVLSDRVTKLERMVEKPAVGEAPSRLAIVGRYLLPPSIGPPSTASCPVTAVSSKSRTPSRCWRVKRACTPTASKASATTPAGPSPCYEPPSRSACDGPTLHRTSANTFES